MFSISRSPALALCLRCGCQIQKPVDNDGCRDPIDQQEAADGRFAAKANPRRYGSWEMRFPKAERDDGRGDGKVDNAVRAKIHLPEKTQVSQLSGRLAFEPGKGL